MLESLQSDGWKGQLPHPLPTYNPGGKAINKLIVNSFKIKIKIKKYIFIKKKCVFLNFNSSGKAIFKTSLPEKILSENMP